MGVISGIATLIPPVYTEGDGFEMSPDVDSAITEDFKCLLLSNGKLYDSDFGCGLNKYLFDQVDQINFGEIESVIHEQVHQYLDSYLTIVEVNFITTEDDPGISPHALVIQIRAQSKSTGAPIPVSVLIDLCAGALSAATKKTTFTGKQHNWLLTE
jgi:hypothetical protein